MALEDTAVKLITKFGRTAALLRKGDILNPAAPWDGNSNEGVSESVTCVFVNFNNSQVDGQTVQLGDMQCLIAAKSTTGIGPEDSIVDGDTKWRVIAANLVKPGNTEYLWKLQVRR
jgi:hypothetical protein